MPVNLSQKTVVEGCATSHHLKWGPLPANEVGRIVQHVRKGEGWKGGKGGVERKCVACCPWSHWLQPKKLYKLVWQYHQFLFRFLAKGHLLRVSRQSANDKGDNEIILGTLHRSLGIDLTAQ